MKVKTNHGAFEKVVSKSWNSRKVVTKSKSTKESCGKIMEH